MQHMTQEGRAADQSNARPNSLINIVKRNREALIFLVTGILIFAIGAYDGGVNTTESQLTVFGTFYVGAALGMLANRH
jgi:hypothetical protein